MNGYIGNDDREQNERMTDTRGTNLTYGVSQLPRLWHEGPSSSVPEHPKSNIMDGNLPIYIPREENLIDITLDTFLSRESVSNYE